VLNKSFVRFLIVGGFAALVNFLSRILLSDWITFRWAVVYAYLIGMLTAYLLSRIYVFEKSGRHPVYELFWFGIVNVFAIIQVWVISVGLVEYAFPILQFSYHPEAVAHLIGLSIPVITSYYGHKMFSFRKVCSTE
jgi:putative flippase GtrA